MAQQAGAGASRVIVQEEEPRLRQIQGVPTAVLGATGVTERGPIGTATQVTSFEEFISVFGGDAPNCDVVAIARGFFEEGGQVLWVTRTVHYVSVDDAATKTSTAASRSLSTSEGTPGSGTVLGSNVGPFELVNGDTLEIAVDGGGALPATFLATQAARTAGAEGPYALVNGDSLTVSIDGGDVQSVTFLTSEFVSIGAATAAEVAAVLSAKLLGASATVVSGAPKITSDSKGTGSGVNVTGGTANAALTFTTGNSPGTGNVADVSAVTVAEIKTIVEAAVAGTLVSDVGGKVRISSTTTGASSSVAVNASSTADDELGFDNATHSGTDGDAQVTLSIVGRYDGSYANRLSFRVRAATNGSASDFDLLVLDDGRVVQTFTNLSMDSASPRYVEAIINDPVQGSRLVDVTDQQLENLDATQRRPADGTSAAMTGGSDGLVGLVDNDYIGSSAGQTGFFAFDTVSELSLLSASGRATSATHNAMLAYCEDWRSGSVLAVLDPPSSLSASAMVDYVENVANILESSEFGAIYWPRVKVLNPNRTVYGNDDQIVVAPSGIVAGVMARTDASMEGGVYQPAAGVERGIMRSVLGFETAETLDERKRDLVYPKRINPLTTDRGLPRYIDGTRTLKSTGNFPSVSERRGVIYIEQSIKRGLEFARHSNNTPELRRRVERTVTAFLSTQMRVGAFRSDDPSTAFFVDFGDALNPDSVVFAGQMIGRIGLATNKPADWIVVRFSQDTRALEAAQSSS